MASRKPPIEPQVLTMAKLRIYQAHGGDIDAWARRGHDESMTDDDWHLIERLRQDLFLAATGRASPQLCAATESRLRAATDGSETREALRELARPRPV
jgi:hypothetical protein